MRSMSRFLLTVAAVFAIATGTLQAQEPEPATEAPQQTAADPAATPTPGPTVPTVIPSEREAGSGAAAPVEAQVEPPAPSEAGLPPVEELPVVEPPILAPVAPAEPLVKKQPVKKPVPKTPKKPLEAAPVPEKGEREQVLDSAAAATDPGDAPPSDPDVAGPTATSADAAPMVPPLSGSADTAVARTDSTDETPAVSGRGAGTWVIFVALALGVLFVAGLTFRRRRTEDLSIFERPVGVSPAPEPPILRQS